jgi:hypothetical protein
MAHETGAMQLQTAISLKQKQRLAGNDETTCQLFLF